MSCSELFLCIHALTGVRNFVQSARSQHAKFHWFDTYSPPLKNSRSTSQAFLIDLKQPFVFDVLSCCFHLNNCWSCHISRRKVNFWNHWQNTLAAVFFSEFVKRQKQLLSRGLNSWGSWLHTRTLVQSQVWGVVVVVCWQTHQLLCA